MDYLVIENIIIKISGVYSKQKRWESSKYEFKKIID